MTARALRRPTRPATLLVLGSLVSGAIIAGLLCLVVFPGAVEAVVTGSLLTGFGLGWGLLAALSPRAGQPQRWAWLPALSMSATGLALIATAPGPHALSRLGWVWPPALAVVAVCSLRGMRRELRGPGRVLLYPVFIGLLVASAGGAHLTIATAGDRARPTMPGAAYEVQGRKLHLDCHGSGSPTVVLEAGLGDSSVMWSRVLPQVAGTTRVCAYDRAGQGWSEEGTLPHDGVQAAHDLHALLDAAGEAGPYVMAGHSSGGTYAMTYAAAYPDDVAGMVLLDSSSPDQFALVPTMTQTFAIARRLVALLPTLSRTGVGQLVPASFASRLPRPAADEALSFATSPEGLRNQRDEQAALPIVFRQAQALKSFGDRPLVVVSAEHPESPEWSTAQDLLAGLSSNTSRRLAPVDHSGVLDDPAGAAISARAVEAVVSAVRRGGAVRGLD